MSIPFYTHFKTNLPLVETDRLVLRPADAGDAARLAGFFNADDRHFPTRWATSAYDVTRDFDETRIREEILPVIRNRASAYELHAFRKTDRNIVGRVEFFKDHADRIRVTYFILPSERRHGYASEAYAACVNGAVAAGLMQDRLYAHTHPDNTMSQEFLMRAGFTNHGEQLATNPSVKNPYPVIAFTRDLSKDNPVSFSMPKPA